MSKEQNTKNFYWVYYILAILSFGYAGAVTFGGFIWTVSGAISGLICAGLYVNYLVKGRVH